MPLGHETALKQIIDELDDIPMLQAGVMHLLSVASDPELDVGLLVQEIEKNQTVMVRVLSIANSSFFKAQSPIVEVKEAVVRIGLHLIGGVIMSITLASSFNIRPIKHFNVRSHWLESVITAYIVFELSRIDKDEQAGFLYTTGLMHNLGNLILVHLFPEKMATVFVKITPYHEEYDDYLVTEFGFNQFYVLGWLLHKWQLPTRFIDVINQLDDEPYFGESNEGARRLNTARKLAHHLLNETEDGKNALPNSLARYELTVEKARQNFKNLLLLADSMCS